MPNPLAIGVTLGGLLLDVVVPRPKPRAGFALESSLLSTRAVSRTPRHAVDRRGVRRSAGRERLSQLSRVGTSRRPMPRYRACRRVASFAVKFLGCKVSQADAMLARGALLAAGHTEVRRGRGRAARDQHVLHHQRGGGQVAPVGAPLAEDARARCYVAGCAVNLDPAQFAEIDARGDAVRRHRRGRRGRDRRGLGAGSRCADLEHDVLGARAAPRRGRASAARTRGFVKVQDGCDCHCAYCIIPTVRGAARSRPASASSREVAARVAAGPARDGDDRDQRRRLPRPGARARARRADDRGRAGARASSACGCRASR